MDAINQRVILGFTDDVGLATVSGRKGDSGAREVVFMLTNELVSYAVKETTYIYWRERTADGLVLSPIEIDKAGLSSDGTELTVALTDEMLSIAGIATCDLVFIEGDGSEISFKPDGTVLTGGMKILSTQSFRLYVASAAYDGGCLSVSDQAAVNSLLPLVISIREIEADFEDWEENEQERCANELQRQNNETARVAQEAARVSAEADRVTAESLRVAAEDSRVSAEDARVRAENDRVVAETDRDAAEAARAAAEAVRAGNEDDRIAAERGRTSAESVRADAEADRVNNESARVRAENARVSAEDGRVAAENARVTAESGRVTAENERERVGQEISAVTFGGRYTDSTGAVQTVTNDYTDPDGNPAVADVSDFDGMSVIAVAVQAKELADRATSETASAKHYAEVAESARDDAQDAATDAISAQGYAEAARDDAQSAQTAAEAAANVATAAVADVDAKLAAAESARDAAKAAEAGADTAKTDAEAAAKDAADTLADVKDVIDNLNSRLTITIDENGHLMWQINS